MDDDEQAVYREFATTPITLLDAIYRLEKLGYEPKEAERIVFEWAEDLDNPPEESPL